MNEQQSKPRFFLDKEIISWLKDNLTLSIHKYNANNGTSIYLPNANKYIDVQKLDTYITIAIDHEAISTTFIDGSAAMQYEVNQLKQIDEFYSASMKQREIIFHLEQRVAQLELAANKAEQEKLNAQYNAK